MWRGGEGWPARPGPARPGRPSGRPSVRPSVRRPSAVRPSVRPSAVRPSYHYYPNGWVCVTLQPLKPRQIARCLRMLTHARSYLNPLKPLSGIPEGSIDSNRSIGDPLGLDRLDRPGITAGSIDSLDRGPLRARSTRSIGDPLGGIP